MILRLFCNIKRVIISLLLFSCIYSASFSQEKIHGIINDYGRVTTIGADFVIVEDPIEYSKFRENDTILLVQMKGVKCIVPENGNYGDYQTSVGTPGGYEFLIVLSKEDLTNKITFRNNIKGLYDVLGDIQIVRVPSYYSPVVDTELTCAPWDSISKTGGILTMIAGSRLTLNANINVRGKGFAGGAPVNSLAGSCIEISPAALNKFSYPEAGFSNSGRKGESHVFKAYIDGITEFPIFPGYAKGMGANFTGGGGGNGRFSGGGGGSLRGAGGNGGDEQSGVCLSSEPGGSGGKPKVTFLPPERIYLGGGGGGSTFLTGATPSAGGRGGGIIIILCETLDGNGYSIVADGETPSQASGNAGSGGGGAGGTISIYLQSFSSTALTISAKGGNGGNNAGTFGTGGTGGGGGGGLINLSNISIPVNITRSVTGGNYGTRSGISDNATSGAIGDALTSFVPVLNGFLFNSIKSSVTASQIDSICSNIIPRQIIGTNPVGGSGSYTYLWQKSYHIPATPSDILLSDTRDYSPDILETGTDSVFFRRIVTDINTLLSDISKWVGIKVQQEITGNDVGKDTIICYNQDPLELKPLSGPPSNGNGIYAYRWIKNSNNLNWEVSPDTTGVGIGESYNPPSLFASTYYKRRVTSGRCVNYSSPVTITVLPKITGNITNRTDSVICEGASLIHW